jgi:hypothetical protein
MLSSWIFRWDPDLNYQGISVVYTVAGVVAVSMYAVETYGSLPQSQWTSNLNGVYMVFAPYLPCLLWVLLIQAVCRRKTLDDEMAMTAKKDQ